MALCGLDERILEGGARLRLEHAEVLLRDRGAQQLGRPGDVGFHSVAVGLRRLRREERGLVDAVAQADVVVGLQRRRAVAERLAAEHLLARLLEPAAERRVRGRKEGTARTTDGGVRGTAGARLREIDRIVPPRGRHRVVQGEPCAGGGRRDLGLGERGQSSEGERERQSTHWKESPVCWVSEPYGARP